MNLRDQKKAETSARLIAAARQMFFERGFADTSMDELCAAAGVTRGALYHNFGGKDGLFEAVVRQIDAEIGDKLMGDPDEPIDLDNFIGTCVTYLEYATDPEVQKIMFQDGPSVLGQRLREIDQEGSIEPLRASIEELQAKSVFPHVDATSLTILLNGAMIDAALWIAAGDAPESRFTTAADTLETLLRRLAG